MAPGLEESGHFAWAGPLERCQLRLMQILSSWSRAWAVLGAGVIGTSVPTMTKPEVGPRARGRRKHILQILQQPAVVRLARWGPRPHSEVSCSQDRPLALSTMFIVFSPTSPVDNLLATAPPSEVYPGHPHGSFLHQLLQHSKAHHF